MTQKALKLRAEVEVHSISCPGVFFPCKGPVNCNTIMYFRENNILVFFRFTYQSASLAFTSKPNLFRHRFLSYSMTSKKHFPSLLLLLSKYPIQSSIPVWMFGSCTETSDG